MKTKYISAWKKVIVICYIHGEFLKAPENHLRGQGCPKCKKPNKLKFTNEKIDCFLIKNNINIKRLDDYKNSDTPIKWLCLKCENKWSTVPNSIRQGTGCPKCKDTKLTNQDIDKFIIENLLPIKRIDNYINSQTKIHWQCINCNNIWLAQPCEIKRKNRGSGCPKCACHKNEKRIGEVLHELNIIYEKICIKTNERKYFPDYFISKFNLIIEYNGIQHYGPIRFGTMTENQANISFQKQQARDDGLRKYCFDNNIVLLEIDGREYKGDKLENFIRDYFIQIYNMKKVA